MKTETKCGMSAFIQLLIEYERRKKLIEELKEKLKYKLRFSGFVDIDIYPQEPERLLKVIATHRALKETFAKDISIDMLVGFDKDAINWYSSNVLVDFMKCMFEEMDKEYDSRKP